MTEKTKKLPAAAVEVILCIAFTLVIGMTVCCAKNSSDAGKPTAVVTDAPTDEADKPGAPKYENHDLGFGVEFPNSIVKHHKLHLRRTLYV